MLNVWFYVKNRFTILGFLRISYMRPTGIHGKFNVARLSDYLHTPDLKGQH